MEVGFRGENLMSKKRQTLTGTDRKGGENQEITRRSFGALTVGGLAAAALASKPEHLIAAKDYASVPLTAQKLPLDLAEWSYFWVGVDRAELASGTVVNGRQMYVESWIPTQVKHPYPVVLVHGGGGQGLDWMGTPDGRPGWAQFLVQEGYRVYVVDRPGHGRSPIHPLTHGGFPPTTSALEGVSGQFTPPNAARPANNEFRKMHNQWPGTGEVGSKDLDQFVASQGGSYVVQPAPIGAPGGRGPGGGPGGRGPGGPGGPGGRGAAPGIAPGIAPAGFGGVPQSVQHQVWRERGALLLDKIGPAIIMTHSAGGPFGWLVAEIRPNLVKGIIAVEGGGTPFGGQNVWGMSTIPVTYDPAVSDPSEIKTVDVPSPEPGVNGYKLQAEPARKLKNLVNIPIAIVTAEASFASPGNPGAVAYFKQAGVKVAEEIRLTKLGIHGNGHMMMVEKNNRRVLQPILDWIADNVERGGKITQPKPAETAIKIADSGFFWTGAEHKPMPYGTILRGQMFVQYFIPQQVRSRYPVVLVHGGGGSMLHYMGVNGMAGWAHYYIQAGYPVYLVDRPGHGRAPYHPDALGPIGGVPMYAQITVDTLRSAKQPNKQWPGTGDIGDPLLDQIMAGQNAAPQDNVMAQGLWASRGAELLDRIGPAIIQVHSAGGPFGYLVANERPNLVKAIVNFEGGGAQFQGLNTWGVTATPLVYDPPASDPSQLVTKDVAGSNGQTYKLFAEGSVRKLKNLQGIPIVYITAERSTRSGEGHVAFLKQAGCDAEELRMKDKGVFGNGHFMMLENNRKQAFDVIKGWIEEKVKA
jgi:pimeloyl-ACP methyl ester carboxylesterase